MPDIHCSIQNCHYWRNGYMCGASEIMVTSDAVGAIEPDSYDAVNHANLKPTPANSCMETCCKTFVDKSSPHIDADGVTRL
ncbi:MAG TPA: DUF1540 domain-containing protein [Firmicutes bacterium]|mgnify:CR=1 FL=1|jgi:hypothetical protein|nr:DUF1540 domain-containing protein [Bacillota bacterium]